MPSFEFQAKTMEGKFVKGDLDAGSDAEARVMLRAQKLIPLKVVPKGGSEGGGKSSIDLGLFTDSVSAKDLQVFTRQFAVLVAAGVPIMQSLEALRDGARSPGMAKALRGVVEQVEKGKRLGEALSTQPRVFDRLYINLVRAGEEGGVLDEVLNRLAEYIEKSVALRSKIVGALWYPAVIIVVAFLVIAGIMVFIIPNFVDMFAQMGEELPDLTLMVINLSEVFQEYWYLLLATFIGLPIALKFYYATDDGRKVLDEVLVRLPLFGGLVQKGSIARMSRTLATLLGAGVRIMDAMDIAASTSGNWVVEKTVLKAKEAVSKGKLLAEPLRQEKIFPSMVTQMIAVGEQTGNLDAMLGKVADFFEDEVEATAEALTSLIEPLLMVFLGGIIAIIVIAMYLPIFNMASAVG